MSDETTPETAPVVDPAPAPVEQPEDEAAVDLSALLAKTPVDATRTTCRACLEAGEADPRVLATTGEGDFPTLAAQHYIAKHGLSTENAVDFPAFTHLVSATDDVLAHNEFWAEVRTA